MIEKRPKLKLEYSMLERFLTATAVVVLILNFVILLTVWNTIPHTIAVKVDNTGKPIGWGSKNSLLMMPIVNVIMFTLLVCN